MSKPRLNLNGRRFGKLTVTERIETKKGQSRFNCFCDCGNTTIVIGSDLNSGNTTSCGCIKKVTGYTSNLIHGGSAGDMAGSYRSWSSMKQRCNNPNSRGWNEYGAKGVTVCKHWLTYENFYADMGDRPNGYSLERIDVFKGYSPENCKWIPLSDQQKNKRNTVRYQYGDEVLIQADLARRLSLHSSSLLEMRRQSRLPTGVQALTS